MHGLEVLYDFVHIFTIVHRVKLKCKTTFQQVQFIIVAVVPKKLLIQNFPVVQSAKRPIIQKLEAHKDQSISVSPSIE